MWSVIGTKTVVVLSVLFQTGAGLIHMCATGSQLPAEISTNRPPWNKHSQRAVNAPFIYSFQILTDGSQRKTLVESKIVYPYGLTLDLPLKVRKSQREIVVSSIPPKNQQNFFDFCPKGCLSLFNYFIDRSPTLMSSFFVEKTCFSKKNDMFFKEKKHVFSTKNGHDKVGLLSINLFI